MGYVRGFFDFYMGKPTVDVIISGLVGFVMVLLKDLPLSSSRRLAAGQVGGLPPAK